MPRMMYRPTSRKTASQRSSKMRPPLWVLVEGHADQRAAKRSKRMALGTDP
jgi:hypothetical protein